jgi:soluble lytic murein transglycosylase
MTDVAKGLLDNGDLTAANAFSEKYKEEIGPRILDLQIAIKGQQELGLAQAAVSATAAVGLPQMAPTDFDRVLNITAIAESGGRETDSQGRTITSSAGAQGVMQVMPSTNLKPGFGVKPAANDTPAERARVGRDYMQAMVTRYNGDVGQAWAAYNAGPGAVDKAMKEHGSDWLAHMPKETQNYVAKNTAAYSSGRGKPAGMTEAEFVNNAVANIQKTQPNASPTLIAKTQQLASQQYNTLKTSIAEKQTAAYNDALSGVLANGGDFYALSPTTRANIPPDKVDSVMSFAKSLSAGPTKSNDATYYTLSTNNDYLAKMSDQDFFALRTELSTSDFKHFTEERAKLRDPTKPVSGKDPGNINREAINSTLSDRLRQININPSPNAKDTEATQRVGAIHKYVTDSLVAAQQQAGHMYSDAEVSDHIDKLFSKNVTFRNEFFGQTTGRTNRQLLGVKYNEIPYQDKDRIIAAFKARGNPNPSQGDILGAYLAHPVAGK